MEYTNESNKRKLTGIFSRVMLDLFAGLSLALIIVVFLSPPNKPVDAVPETSLPPLENRPGDEPGAGQQILKAQLSQNGTMVLNYKGKTYNIESFNQSITNHEIPFPDHIVFDFADFQDFQLLGKAALESDAAVSLELKR